MKMHQQKDQKQIKKVCEDLNLPEDIIQNSSIGSFYEINCQLISIKCLYECKLKLFSTYFEIIFINGRIISVQYIDISELHHRTRFHKHNSLEIFIFNGRSFFLCFEINSFPIIELISSKCLKNIKIQKNTFKSFFNEQKFTNKWINGQISNFEYLMYLNIFSGRSFNDASQYPIFPWIIKDYENNQLNLNDENIYRDLSKPIGALNEERLNSLKEKQNQLILGENEENYLYSSGPVSILTVSLFLVRIEPFTSLHIFLQGGRFDLPERQIFNIKNTYEIISKQGNEYWELIPEFFYQSEFLLNLNQFNLGIKEGNNINNIILPNWASNSLDFKYLHKKALDISNLF